MMKKILWIGAILLVVLAGYRIADRIASSRQVVEDRVIPVVAQAPRVGAIAEKLTLTGDVKGRSEVSVKPTSYGRVEEIYVEEGENVLQGDPLMSFVAGITPDNDMYSDMVTFAPIAGIVGIKNVKIGDQVEPGKSSAFVIYSIDRVKIYAAAPEKYYSKINPGTPAIITLDSYPDRTFAGKVLNKRPVIDPMSRTSQIEIDIPNPGRIIKPGMFSKVELILNKRSSALIVPFDAVLSDGSDYVFVVQGDTAAKRTVKTGISQDNDIEIVSGLSASDRVIVTGQRVVKEGSKVKESDQ